MKPSARPVSRTSPPALSIAARAARDARDRMIEIVERFRLVAGRILDREAGDAGLDAKPHAFGDALRLVRVAALEIGVHRQVGRPRRCSRMWSSITSRGTAPSASPDRPGGAGARRRQRLEAEMLEIAGAADVPWIGDDEAAGLMQAAKGLRLSEVVGMAASGSSWRAINSSGREGINPVAPPRAFKEFVPAITFADLEAPQHANSCGGTRVVVRPLFMIPAKRQQPCSSLPRLANHVLAR